MTAVDSQNWTCRGCQGPMIGKRPADNLCLECAQASSGPFETERQARDTPAVRAVWAAWEREPGVGRLAIHNHRLLCEAVSAAGVELGAFDHRILNWLSGYEPATCAAIAGIIRRAGEQR